MASIRLNKQTYSRLAMLEHELYEMARAKVERTIDPKLWAAMASLCSRTYKSDLGEFAKPLGNTKDVVLARYVAGLIIMKQPCPSSEADIDRIKALKLYGHKLIDEYNTSIAEIQKLYNENCGNLPKANISGNPSANAPQTAVQEPEAANTTTSQQVVSDEPVEQTRTNKHASNIRNKIGKVQKKAINDIWNNIMDRTEKALEAEKQVKQTKKSNTPTYKPIDVSKIDKLKVRRRDGSIDEIYPARIARYASYFVGQLGQDPDTKILKKYFPKNIIWTFEVRTAATDGIRVFFNPAFADRLFSLDSLLISKRMKTNPNIDPEEINGTMFQFVLIHEIYHQIYRHMHRIRMKPETASALSNKSVMDLANIACDVEINRDIEYQLPKFQGCTELLQGMFDKRFTHETWELIFDAYNTGEANPPQTKKSPKGKNPTQPQQQQGGGEQDDDSDYDENQGSGTSDGEQDNEQSKNTGKQQGKQGTGSEEDDMNSQGAGGDDEDDDYGDGDSTDSDYDGDDEDYDGEDSEDEGDSSASANGRPSLEGKSEAYLRGFREALEKIKRGEIDIDNWTGFMTESADFNFNATLAYRTKGALGKKNRPQEGAAQTPQQTAPAQPQSTATMASSGTAFGPEATQSPAEEKADYDKGFADAIKAMKDAIKNKKKQHKQNSGNNMSDMPDMSDVLGGDDNNDSDDDEENNNSNGNGGSNNSEDGGIQDDTSGDGMGNLGDVTPDIGDDSNEVDKTISGEGMEADSYDDDGFEPDDMISKEEAQKMAEAAGQPYDADDMGEDAEQKARNFVKNNRDALNKIGKKSHGAGSGKCMSDVLDHIDSLFKSTVNWKNQLQAFLNGLAKTGRDYEFQRRRIGTDNPVLRPSRYIKYNEITFDEKTAVAQVFYLIDNSGSMYGQSRDGGETVFMQIFSDILHMQKRAKIQKSALTYFSYGEIDKRKIRMWDHKTPESRIKTLIGRNKDDSGGTDICGSINQIYNMGKPYYSKNDPKTLMIVMTDGEDNLSIVKDLPSVIRQNIIFLILNSENKYLQSAQDQLVEAGIKRSRVLLVDTNDIKK